MIGRWRGLIIDCSDPGALAGFYQELLGMQRIQDEDDWVVIGDAPDRPGVAFQRAPGLRPPQWPDPEHPQQLHIDVRVSDLGEGEQAVLALGPAGCPVAEIPSGCSATPPGIRSAGCRSDPASFCRVSF